MATEGDDLAFNHDRHWISAAVESGLPGGVDHPVLSGLVKFGTLPTALLFVFAHVRGGELSGRFLFAITLTVVALDAGPLLIWYYDERVMPQFFAKATELLPASRLHELARQYDTFFARRYWVLAGGFALLMGYTFGQSTEFLVRVGVFEAGGPFHYLLFALILWTGVLGGIAFHGVFTTLRLIRAIAAEDLEIDPLHPDKLGGLSVIGYYAIRTTAIFSTGSLFIPLAYQFVDRSPVGGLIYVIVGLYMAVLLLSFVVPTVRVNRRANALREEVLDDLRHQRRELADRLSAHGRVESTPDERLDELILERQAQRIRNEYQDYAQVRLYPLEIKILTRLVGSVFLPLGFLVLDILLSRLI